MTRRRRFVLYGPAFELPQLLTAFLSQPYIEQAARDKDRAEQEKKDYDVRLVFPQLIHSSLITFHRHRPRRLRALAPMRTTTNKCFTTAHRLTVYATRGRCRRNPPSILSSVAPNDHSPDFLPTMQSITTVIAFGLHPADALTGLLSPSSPSPSCLLVVPVCIFSIFSPRLPFLSADRRSTFRYPAPPVCSLVLPRSPM